MSSNYVTITKLRSPLSHGWSWVPFSFGPFDEGQPTTLFEFTGTTLILSLKYIVTCLTGVRILLLVSLTIRARKEWLILSAELQSLTEDVAEWVVWLATERPPIFRATAWIPAADARTYMQPLCKARASFRKLQLYVARPLKLGFIVK